MWPYSWSLREKLVGMSASLPSVIRSFQVTAPSDLLRLRDMNSLVSPPVFPAPSANDPIARRFIYPIISIVCINHTRITTPPPNLPMPANGAPPGDDLVIVCADGHPLYFTREQLGDMLMGTPVTALTVSLSDTTTIQTQYLWDAFVSYGSIFWVKGQRLLMAAQRPVPNLMAPSYQPRIRAQVHQLLATTNPAYNELLYLVTANMSLVSLRTLHDMIRDRGDTVVSALRLICIFYHVDSAKSLWQLRNIVEAAGCLTPPIHVLPQFAAAVETIFAPTSFPHDLTRTLPDLSPDLPFTEDTFIVEGHPPTTRSQLAPYLDAGVATLGFSRDALLSATATFGYRFVVDGARLVMVRSLTEVAPQSAVVPVSERPHVIAAGAAIQTLFQTMSVAPPIDPLLHQIDTMTDDEAHHLTTVAFACSARDIGEIPIFRALTNKSPAAADAIRAWCQRTRVTLVIHALFLSRLVALLTDLHIACPIVPPNNIRLVVRHAYAVIASQSGGPESPDPIHPSLNPFLPTTSECYNAIEDRLCPIEAIVSDPEQVFFRISPTSVECQTKAMLARRVDGSLEFPTDYIGVGLLAINVRHIVEAALTPRQIFYTRQVARGQTDLMC